VRRLTRRIAVQRAIGLLSRRFGRAWTNGRNKRVSCAPAQGNSYLCNVSWTYRGFRYRGQVVVLRNGVLRARIVRRR
jgi:hypothetical protein